MRVNGSVLLAATMIVGGLWMVWPTPEVEQPAGILVPNDPVQQAVNRSPFAHPDGAVDPVATFELEARVLSREDYWAGRESDFSPTDLALGWGPMSDSSVLEHIDIRQSGRWYHWSTREFPITRKAIETNSANMHIIPANPSVEDALDDVRAGHIVRLRGYLVNVVANDGWTWRSSLTRQDTGANACEVVYVEELIIL